MKDVINRYKTILNEHQTDQHSAATLVLAEAVNTLVKLLTNVDQVVTKIEADTIRNTPVNIPNQPDDQAVKYIQDRYVNPNPF